MDARKQRWRKDKKDPETNTTADLTVVPQDAGELPPLRRGFDGTLPPENHAGSSAFRGLHGARTDFTTIASASDMILKTVLDDNAFYYKELLCRSDDFTLFERLVKELEFRPCWMSGGAPLWRPTAIGTGDLLQQSPTYARIVRWLAGYFGAQPVRSIANFYRNGDDYTSPHSDQHFNGSNMTIGASFGEERLLNFEHIESKEQFNFPQSNGDIFAFTDVVNYKFVHSVPKEKRRALSASRRCGSGRVSVIVWATRDHDAWRTGSDTIPLNILNSHHISIRDPKVVDEHAEQSTASAHPHFSMQAPPSVPTDQTFDGRTEPTSCRGATEGCPESAQVVRSDAGAGDHTSVQGDLVYSPPAEKASTGRWGRRSRAS